MRCLTTVAMTFGALMIATTIMAQQYGQADRGSPGDEMIQAYLAHEAVRLDAALLDGIKTLDDWQRLRPQWHAEYLYMLGLDPMPEKGPLHATVTGTYEGDGFVVEKLHYQSRPRLYVTANLYRPTTIEPGQRLPAVLYLCGHSAQGRNGNKTAYQSHGIWFARHGYVCLTLDSLQLGEIAAIHHGTYREGRWWWHSRGYTPAGVECLNGIRGIDYLQGREDVDPKRIAVTGISGGGAATFWIAAADDRAAVAVPVSGMADLESYLGNRVINGHCDCMFMNNAMQWPWTRIAALIAPRPQLFTNSDLDAIFPMDANQRVINRLERVYSLYGSSDHVDAMVSIGGHAYRQDLRQGIFRFINTHLKDDPRAVTDSEVDLVTGSGTQRHFPIAPERLRAFTTDEDLPKDELNTTIDEHFVPIAKVELPAAGAFKDWRDKLMTELRRVTFRYLPDRVPAARLIEEVDGGQRIETETGIRLTVRPWRAAQPAGPPNRILLLVRGPGAEVETPAVRQLLKAADAGYILSPRGVSETRWTTRNPPNFVERSLVLLGRTADTCRVWDIIATARYLREKHGGQLSVHVVGDGAAGVLAAYAAIFEPEIAGVVVSRPPSTHSDAAAPQLLNVLRVCDVPDVLGMIAPRPLRLIGVEPTPLDKVTAIYTAAGAADQMQAEAAQNPAR